MADGPITHLTLTVHGPDLQAFELTDVPVDTCVRDVARAVIDQYPGAGELRYVVDFQDPDGSYRRLDPEATLEEADVTSAGTLTVSAEATAGGLGVEAMVDLVTFLAGAVAGGVAGNAAYDLLKNRVAAMKGRRVRRLRKREAIQVARACICIQRGLSQEQVRLAGASRGTLHKREGERRAPRAWVLDFEFGEETDTVWVFLDRSEVGAEAIKLDSHQIWLSSLTQREDPPST
ncbi:hypothetical protein ACIBQ1_34535 [Nonomuraea sp. NPDC050153]|uniref:hypothetical protein n=1 Tax=Nonomuraea sp. NPDC050153 TaxID=3364359 RepID=UPI0037ABAB8B